MAEKRKTVKLGNKLVGDGQPVYVIAEIGINHNGDMDTVKKLIDVAVTAQCNAVKFQKRTINVIYTPEELEKPRENPFGETNGDLKRGLEFGQEEYEEIDNYCRQRGIDWFASPWDEGSVEFLSQFDIPAVKVASASLTDDNLLQAIRKLGKTVILSTGMSTMEEIDHAVDVLGEENLIILHCTSTYPGKLEELNLNVIKTLRNKFSNIPIGYSGHSTGATEPVIAAALGACIVEKHITLDRAMFGSDQAASLEPAGLYRMVRDLKNLPIVLGDGEKKVYDSERPILEKLRRVKG